MLLVDLPDDILHAIFVTPLLECILERSVYTNEKLLRQSMDEIHDITHISSRIRTISISSPQLWSVLNNATFSREDELRTWLERSGDAKLTIALRPAHEPDGDGDGTGRVTDSFMEHLFQHKDNWSVLHASAITNAFLALANRFSQIPDKRLPSLEVLDVHVEDARTIDIYPSNEESFPRLRQAILVPPELTRSPLRPSVTLSSLILGEVWANDLTKLAIVRDCIASQPQLLELVVDFTRIQLDTPSPSAIVSLEPIHLPALRRLWIGIIKPGREAWEFSLLLRAPNVQTLVLAGCAWDQPDAGEQTYHLTISHSMMAMPLVETLIIFQVNVIASNIWSLLGRLPRLKNLVFREVERMQSPDEDCSFEPGWFPSLKEIRCSKFHVPTEFVHRLFTCLLKTTSWQNFKSLELSVDHNDDPRTWDDLIDKDRVLIREEQGNSWLDYALELLK